MAYEISECDWSSDVCFFFFKQKTAYEISECDWSSDVCSSDLVRIESFEIGYGYVGSKLKLNVNAYTTNWGNRFVSRSLSNQQGIDGTAQFRNIDVTHRGIEAEATYSVGTTKLRGM